MRFGRTPEQHAFAGALDDLLRGADVPAVARAWASGSPEPGLVLWRRLADLGVTGLLVPEEHDGLDGSAVDVAVALERLGYHGVPGPWVESVAVLPELLAQTDAAKVLASLASGEALATLAAPPGTPRALDADVAEHVYALGGSHGLDRLDHRGGLDRPDSPIDETATLAQAEAGRLHESVDPTRRLFDVEPGEDVTTVAPSRALDLGSLACAAQLLGAGQRLLDDTVAYAKQRHQFGKPVGSQQAVKHLLADVRVALEFAAPLVHHAALTLAPRDVSAAKVSAGEAAYLASRTALQVHGAIGYTLELDLSLWILKVCALVGAWGMPSFHRTRILEALVGEGR